MTLYEWVGTLSASQYMMYLITGYPYPMFRGKRVSDGKWIYHLYLEDKGREVRLGWDVVEKGSQGILTRKADSNGVWIFSKDILLTPNNGEVEVLMSLYEGMLVKSVSTGKEYTIPFDEIKLSTVISNTHDSTVVNNMYEQFLEEHQDRKRREANEKE